MGCCYQNATRIPSRIGRNGPWEHRSLTQLALRLVPKILGTVDVVPIVREELAVIDPDVVKVGYIQHVLTAPAVRIDDAMGNDLALVDWHQNRR